MVCSDLKAVLEGILKPCAKLYDADKDSTANGVPVVF